MQRQTGFAGCASRTSCTGEPRCGARVSTPAPHARACSARPLGDCVLRPPYPELSESVELVKVASLDLYREPDPFRVPRLREFTSAVDLLEFALMCTRASRALTFSLRARRLLPALGDFDLVHDNQSLALGSSA